MEKLSSQDYERFVCNAAILSGDARGIKVFRSSDGNIVKLFRQKHLISSARIYPYSSRFVRNTGLLRERGIKTVKVLAIYDVPSIKRHAVVYEPLAGSSLRESLMSESAVQGKISLLERFASFLALLHRRGILFRSIHFANILVLPSGEFALIDISHLHLSRWGSLSVLQRFRNFRHLCRYREDMTFLHEAGFQGFLDAYFGSSDLSRLGKQVLAHFLRIYWAKKSHMLSLTNRPVSGEN